MKTHWNSCFLCLNDLNLKLPSTSGTARGRKRKCDPSPNVITLMKYLLQTDNNKYDKLLKGILEASKCTDDYTEEIVSQSSTFPIHFCDECISSIKRVSELHTQLETLQMKLVDSLKDMREKIIFNSKAHGSNEATKASLRIFEDFLVTLENQQGRGHNGSSQLERKRLDLLFSFQDAIFERRETQPLVPFVFLEPISNFRPQPASADYKDETPVHLDPLFPKLELAEYQWTGDEFEESQSPPELENNEDMDMYPAYINQHVKEESSTRILRSATSRKVKVEETVTNEPIPIKSVANTTRNRGIHQKQKRGVRRQQRKLTIAQGKRFFKCKTCPFTNNRGWVFEHHLRGHETTDKIYTCSICEQKFSGKQLFDFHRGLHAGSRSMVTCDFEGCSERVTKAELPDHIQKNHGKVFLCQCCSFSSSTRHKYVMHIRCHSKHNLICDVCSTRFKRREKLFSHMFEEHGVAEVLKCGKDGCEETFLDPLRLVVHEKTHDTIYECKECNRRFLGKHEQNLHMQIHSKRENSFNCDLCPKLFISRFALENHKLKDHDAPKLICPYCQQEFPDYRKLLRHITKSHEGAQYPCSYCDLMFRTTKSWRRHQFIHSAGSTFVCEECGKIFNTREGWTTHIKLHGEKTHKCSYCPKSFAAKRNLTWHIRTHTGERPYVCDVCGKAFALDGSMRFHKKMVHGLRKDANKKRGKAKKLLHDD